MEDIRATHRLRNLTASLRAFRQCNGLTATRSNSPKGGLCSARLPNTMAKVTYIDPIKSVSGKLTKSHSTVLNVRRAATSNQDMIDNPCYTSWRDPSKKVQLTSGQQTWTQTFKQICANVRARMKDPSKITADQIAFAAQSKYKTMYQYLWHQERDAMN